MQPQRQFWFPAKRYGWGWGLPITWQGWLVLCSFFFLVILGALAILPSYGHIAFAFYVVLLIGLLVAVCWRTGEPSRWRWDGK